MTYAYYYNGHLRGPVTPTPITERLVVEHSPPVLRLWSIASGIRTPNLPHARRTLWPTAHRRDVRNRYSVVKSKTVLKRCSFSKQVLQGKSYNDAFLSRGIMHRVCSLARFCLSLWCWLIVRNCLPFHSKLFYRCAYVIIAGDWVHNLGLCLGLYGI